MLLMISPWLILQARGRADGGRTQALREQPVVRHRADGQHIPRRGGAIGQLAQAAPAARDDGAHAGGRHSLMDLCCQALRKHTFNIERPATTQISDNVFTTE